MFGKCGSINGAFVSSTGFLLRLTEAFFFPGVAAHVVPSALPIARLVASDKLDSADPLSALPGIQAWNHEPKGATVLRRNGLPIVGIRKEGVFSQEIVESHVRCPIGVVSLHQHIARLWQD